MGTVTPACLSRKSLGQAYYSFSCSNKISLLRMTTGMVLCYSDRLGLRLQRYYNLDALRWRVLRLPVHDVGNRQGRAEFLSPYIPGIPFTAKWPHPISFFEENYD